MTEVTWEEAYALLTKRLPDALRKPLWSDCLFRAYGAKRDGRGGEIVDDPEVNEFLSDHALEVLIFRAQSGRKPIDER